MLVQDQTPADVMNTLDALHVRFNKCFQKDVFVFHTGGIPKPMQDHLAARFPGVRLRLLPSKGDQHWRPVPAGLARPPRPVDARRYAAARWHSLGAFEYLGDLGYEWLMRWEPGGYLLSCVASDPFRLLETRGMSHGYRIDRTLPAKAVAGLPALAQKRTASGRLLPARLLARFRGGRLASRAWDGRVQDGGGAVTRVSFWRSPGVRAWLLQVDAAGLAYHAPLQDAALQTFTRALFAREGAEEAHRFRDWSYLHDGELAVAPHALWPSLSSALFSPGYQWRASAERLRADPRYRTEFTWVQRNIIGPLSRRKFWCFRLFQYLI